ncbi:MAG: YggT family protein [Woeseiaceae bacterium]|nr:YggT family protein [Woeseiaceae bacterium]
MTNTLIQSLLFVLQIFGGLYILLLLLRLMLPWMPDNYRNPMMQAIFAATSPLVIPVRKVLPPIGKLDTATLMVAFGIQYLLDWLSGLLVGRLPGLLPLTIGALFGVFAHLLQLMTIAIIIRIVLSWIAPDNYNPATMLIRGATDPILRPFQRVVPVIGGFDVSPIFAIAALGVAGIVLNNLELWVVSLFAG